MPIDLDAYLARIGYQGPRQADHETLSAICALHPEALTFNSIDPWLGRPVRLDLPTLQAKLIRDGRGGYCYEHNTLLWAALESLGFQVRGLSARVVYSTPPGGGRHPRNHMLMLVECAEGRFIADAGFGGLTLTAPLRLEADMIQQTPHERVRLGRAGQDYVLEAEAGDSWRAMYQFGLEEHIDADYEMANWFMSTYPGSAFVQRLIAARPIPGGRLALADAQLSVHRVGRQSERRMIADAVELRRLLEDDFAIRLPDDPTLADRLRRIVATPG